MKRSKLDILIEQMYKDYCKLQKMKGKEPKVWDFEE